MTRSGRLIAFVGLVALACAACGRTSNTGGSVQPLGIFTNGLSISDVGPILGDESNWWPGPPTVGARPLDTASLPNPEQFQVTLRFTHVGTSETLVAIYRVWDSTSVASSVMSNVQTTLGSSLSGPKAGDQVLYYQQQLSGGAAPYDTTAFIRLGQILISTDWTRSASFPAVSALGRIAIKQVARLKDLLAGKAPTTPLPSTDSALLPPPGPYMTLLGSARVPVETAVLMVNAADPHTMDTAFHGDGLSSFVFGDYTLDSDTHMEVRSGVLQFPSPTEAKAWLDGVRGTNQLTPDGYVFFYDDVSGQYFLMFVSGSQGALLICRSVADIEAASRSCELPITTVAPVWRTKLGG